MYNVASALLMNGQFIADAGEGPRLSEEPLPPQAHPLQERLEKRVGPPVQPRPIPRLRQDRTKQKLKLLLLRPQTRELM